ncbi:hypothetical protein [Nocardia pseudobrasiliensis]|uniref:Uncharacterized protein n=1 Tax=Nocardia pseudobrasiliensis TaxID=45979 RepID=A0A370HKH9_9NOCA|nr:hypothetical protein [Nocardia pseudobrasiliensis]RDI59086.1 hypothetical protein DFR76_11947 [Nocardia pseudobrasiliensis]
MVTIGAPATGRDVVDPVAGLLDPATAPVSYGYYAENADDAASIERHRRVDPDKTIGWWNRHRPLQWAIGATLALNLGLMPSIQDALLTILQHL